MKYLKATLLGSGALASLLLSSVLTSCQDEDFGYTTQQIRDSVYARNFEKMYGEIAEDQIWDFSSYNLKKLGLTGGPSNDLTTRATANDVKPAPEWPEAVTVLGAGEDKWYDVDQTTIDWLNLNLPEKEEYTGNLSEFTLKKTDNFYIIPIYQGQSGMIWDLELVDNNGRHRIWSKSENFQYTYDFTKWEEFFYDTNNGEEFYSTQYTVSGNLTTDPATPRTFTDWSGSNYLTLDVSNFILGDVISIDVSGQGNGPAITVKTTDWNTTIANGKWAGQSPVNITVDQAFKNALGSNSQIIIQGKNVTIDRINQVRGGDGKGLKFKRIFQYFNPNSGWDIAKVFFQVPQDLDVLEGYFYINDGSGQFVQLDKSWFIGDGLYTTVSNITNDGRFTFRYADNPQIDFATGNLADGHTGNQVDLSKLVKKTINGHYIGDHLENLVFHATSTNFNTYTPDHKRIKIYVKYNAEKTVGLSNQASTAYVDGHTINKRDVQTKLIKIDSNKIEGLFKFNLYTTDLTAGDKDGYSDYGANHYSDEKYMLALTAFSGNNSPIDKETLGNELNRLYELNLPSNYEYMVLSCEDADGRKSDNDYNDVIFLVVGGPRLPEISDKTIQKRYMIEDLGSTYDFDFNDIVVDVSEEHVRNLADPSQIKVRQTATISHLCGTIPFMVYLGSKSFGNNPMYGHNNKGAADGYNPATSPNSSDYTTTLYLSPEWLNSSDMNDDAYAILRSKEGLWDPETNNIKVFVWPGKSYKESEVGVYWEEYNAQNDDRPNDNLKGDPNHVYERQKVEFPNKGKFPYIIATDPDVDWMKENVSIPVDWIKTKPQEYDDYIQNGGSFDPNDDSGTNPQTPSENKNLNNGPITLGNDGSWTQGYYTIDQTTANSLVAGNKLVVSATNNNFEIVLGGEWGQGKLYKADPSDANDGTYILVLNDYQVSKIKGNNTITFNGNNVTIFSCRVE